MNKDEPAGAGSVGDFGQFYGGGVDGFVVLLPAGRPTLPRLGGINLMHQNVAAGRVLHQGLGGAGVARDDDGFVGGGELEAVGFEAAVGNGKRFHGDALILVDDAGGDVVRLHDKRVVDGSQPVAVFGNAQFVAKEDGGDEAVGFLRAKHG